jgi:hypothetical protein
MLFFKKLLPERDVTNVSIFSLSPGEYGFMIVLQALWKPFPQQLFPFPSYPPWVPSLTICCDHNPQDLQLQMPQLFIFYSDLHYIASREESSKYGN